MDRRSASLPPTSPRPHGVDYVVGKNGVKHPSREHRRRYESWRGGHGMLGRDAQKIIESLVHEFMQEKHDECVNSREKMDEFIRSHDELLDQCWLRIEAYENAATEFRNTPQVGVDGRPFRLRRFSWNYETTDTIRSLLRKKNNQSILPLSALEKEARAMFAEAQKETSIWRQPIRSKVDQETVLYSKHGGIAPRSVRLNSMEGLDSIVSDVVERFKASGVFLSIQNTKVKK